MKTWKEILADDSNLLTLIEAIMDRAYEDLKSPNLEIRKDAEEYIERMKRLYG